MPTTLAAHFALIEDEYAAALRTPLSARQAMLVAVLLDKFAERVFEACRVAAPGRIFGTEDLPAFRDVLRKVSPAMGAIIALCALDPAGPRLVTHAVTVPLEDYPRLSVEDFMVSLYNRHTVQRVLIAFPDGTERLAHDVLGEALSWWRTWMAASG